MGGNILPPVVVQAASGFILGLAILMIGVHVTLTAWGAARAAVSERARRLAPLLVAGFLGAWLAAGIVTAQGNLATPPQPARPPVFFAVMLVPFAAAMALLYLSRGMRAINDAMPREWLVRAQTYRLAGFLFLYPFLFYGTVPAAFALPAAIGDMLTGALAPLVARGLASDRPGAARWALAWNLFGILDLVVAPAMALLSGARVIDQYPLALVPLFLGPPLGILTHVYSLRNLSGARRAQRQAAAAASVVGPVALPAGGRA